MTSFWDQDFKAKRSEPKNLVYPSCKARPHRAKNIKRCNNIKHDKNENLQKHVILEGFSQNGLQI